MRAISLWEPWATAIREGLKTIETRSWAPPTALLGQRIAVGATRHVERKGCPRGWTILKRPSGLLRLVGSTAGYDLSPGCVVATAVLATALPIVDQDALDLRRALLPGDRVVALDPEGYVRVWTYGEDHEPAARVVIGGWSSGQRLDEGVWGDYTPGRWAWMLADVEKVDPPIPAKGKQGWWSWDG